MREIEPWRSRAARPGAGSRPHFPAELDTHCRAPGLLLRRASCGCAATTTPPRWSAAGRGRRTCAPTTSRSAGSCSRPGAGCARWARQPAAAAPDAGARSATLRDRGRMTNATKPRALAHPGLALQREGALGARPQGGRARAPGAAPRRPHGDRAVAHPRRRTRPSPCSQLDGRNIGDSTAIIEALERRWPEPPLYPGGPGRAPPGARARGLLRRGARPADPAARLARAAQRPRAHGRGDDDDGPGAAADSSPGGTASRGRFGTAFTQLRFRVAADEAADAARRDVLARRSTGSRPSSTPRRRVPRRRPVLGRRPDRGGALLPARQPARGPADPPQRPPPGFEEFRRARVAERPGYQLGRRDLPQATASRARREPAA